MTDRVLPRYETIRSRIPLVHGEASAVEACVALLRVASDVHGVLNVNLVQHGLSQGRFSILVQIRYANDEGLTPADLAERVGVTRATITGLLDGLERAGLSRRTPHTSDRRRLVVRLTPQGRKLLDRVLPSHYARIGAVMAGLTSADRTSLLAQLDKINAALEGAHVTNAERSA